MKYSIASEARIHTFNYEFVRHVPLSFCPLYARQVRVVWEKTYSWTLQRSIQEKEKLSPWKEKPSKEMRMQWCITDDKWYFISFIFDLETFGDGI